MQKDEAASAELLMLNDEGVEWLKEFLTMLEYFVEKLVQMCFIRTCFRH